MKKVAEAINKAFWRAYPTQVDLYTGIKGDEIDEKLLIKRVEMLIDELMCNRISVKILNTAYCKLDRKHRSIREHWWQLWRSWKKYQCAPMPERRKEEDFVLVERRKN